MMQGAMEGCSGESNRTHLPSRERAQLCLCLGCPCSCGLKFGVGALQHVHQLPVLPEQGSKALRQVLGGCCCGLGGRGRQGACCQRGCSTRSASAIRLWGTAECPLHVRVLPACGSVRHLDVETHIISPSLAQQAEAKRQALSMQYCRAVL